MEEFVSLKFLLTSLLVGYLAVPFFQTLSLQIVQLIVIRKHKLPWSGIMWRTLPVTFMSHYVGFLLRPSGTALISCRMKNGGGFEWRGTFNFRVW